MAVTLPVQAYVTNFNKAIEALEDAKSKSDSQTIVTLTKALKFNGGGTHVLPVPSLIIYTSAPSWDVQLPVTL